MVSIMALILHYKGTPIKATNGKVTRIFNNELGGKALQIAGKTMENITSVSTLRQI